MPDLDLSKVAFSAPGAWPVLFRDGEDLILKLAAPGRAFRVRMLRGSEERPFTTEATPWQATLRSDGGTATFFAHGATTLGCVLRGAGLEFELLDCRPWATAILRPPETWEVLSWETRTFFSFTPIRGCRAAMHAPWVSEGKVTSATEVKARVTAEGEGLFSISVDDVDAPPAPLSLDPEAEMAKQRAEWRSWLAKMPAVPERYREAAEVAWYVLWASRVPVKGYFTRPAILMSKLFMTAVWTWDHCFNALALAPSDPKLSWDQLMMPFDHQAESGRLPDSINARELAWSFVKPPMHGWTARRLLEKYGERAHFEECYERLARWTEWWFAHRDDDGDGVCQYHHGNDSGWDNATAFDVGVPLEGADLGAYLVLQMDALAWIAERLGRCAEAASWRRRSEDCLSRFIAHSWREGGFVSPQSGTHRAEPTHSLLNAMPIVLGDRLPEAQRRALVEALSREGYWLTEHGLATEAVTSPHYREVSYWRGPMWAPTTYLIVDGLRHAGETQLAEEIARRFCDTVSEARAMHENYSPLTGQGNDDPAYTWTASVFLLLASELLR